MKDPFVMKSNYISYNAHASWQQEVRAAAERSRKYIAKYLGSSVEVIYPEAEVLFMASGTAAAQSRVAMERLREEGIDVGLAKIKVIRPFPDQEVIEAAERARTIIVPEHNITGWLAREIKSRVNDNARIYAGPRVFGGMTMPPEVIVTETKKLLAECGHLGLRRPLVAARG
jgi:pyruvate ferredoxin oxidoreductase alpha subunit